MKNIYYNTRNRKKTGKKIRIFTYTAIAIIAFFLVSWAYTEHYLSNMVSEAKAQVPKAEVKAEQSLLEQICEATNGENCQVIYNLCKAESGCKKYAINKNNNGTYDFSWLQINSIHFKSGAISYDCAYDLACVSQWANEKIKAGKGSIWTAWSKI